jgi:homoserine dehydrogenase
MIVLLINSIVAYKVGLRAVTVDTGYGCHMSSDDVAALYPLWLEKGIHVITLNKKAFFGDIGLCSNIVNYPVRHT